MNTSHIIVCVGIYFFARGHKCPFSFVCSD